VNQDAPIEIVAYDPAWPRMFEEERARLEAAIAPWVTGGIHHVGSTAVPGLAAKPVIDVLAGVGSLDASRASFAPLKQLDYDYAPYREQEMHWFCKPSRSYRTHHLHLIPTASERYREELAFRDALRADPSIARDYEQLKRVLADSYRHDREAYTDAKAGFVAEVLAGT
jgi:GrpB-like predicted nucleotidyltransferase (UPF0157 family)